MHVVWCGVTAWCEGVVVLTSVKTKRAFTVLLKDPGFSKDSVDLLLRDDPFAPSQRRSADEPSTSTAPPPPPSYRRRMTTEGFSLKHREEVSEKEYQDVEQMASRLNNWIEQAKQEHEEPMDEESLCTICYANELSVSFTPCGHTSCKSCVSYQLMNSKECFFCKVHIDGFTPISKDTE